MHVKRFINSRFALAMAFSLLVWALVAISAHKAAQLYAGDGPAGFRHAVRLRLDRKLDHKIDEFMTVTVGGAG